MTSKSRATYLKTELKKVPGLLPLARLCKIVCNPAYRSELKLKRKRPDNLFQPYGFTAIDRYPRIFTFVSEQLQDIVAPRLLSYGCSTGEEAFSLRRYFPLAEIVGLDINPRSIAVCRKKLNRSGDPRMCFKQASSAKAEPESYYDAVFCMSVLRHGDLGVSTPETCGHLIRFADFEQLVTELGNCLKPGGYLVIGGSNFRFADTLVSAGFDAVFSLVEKAPRKDTPLYGPDNRYLADALYNEIIFRKRTKS